MAAERGGVAQGRPAAEAEGRRPRLDRADVLPVAMWSQIEYGNLEYGFAIGFVAIQGLNLVRIISLFYLGQWNFTVFEWFHLYLWQALIILDAMVVWLIWLRTLPQVVERMMKPAEKIESIRINHITGFGRGGGATSDPGGSSVAGFDVQRTMFPLFRRLAQSEIGQESCGRRFSSQEGTQMVDGIPAVAGCQHLAAVAVAHIRAEDSFFRKHRKHVIPVYL